MEKNWSNGAKSIMWGVSCLEICTFSKMKSSNDFSFRCMRSEASWLEPSWRHEGSIMWSPHDVMRAPSCGALMMAWGLRHVEPSWRKKRKLLMPSWGFHQGPALNNQENQQTSKPANKQTSKQVNKWTIEQMNKWKSEQVNKWTFEHVNLWTCEQVNK